MSSNYYDQATLWNAAPSAAQVDVAQALKARIPEDVRTILDAGCGSGIVTNALVDQWDVMGCDISQTALAQVNAPTVLADLTDLPFEDQKFDLVLSSDVIEHIPDSVYRAAIKEIARVASKYILIAVPYQEILEASTVQCPKCRCRFHAHYHQRSYSATNFEDLFPPEFEVVSTSLAGERWPFSNVTLSQTGLELADLDYEFPSAICPDCGTQREARLPSQQAAILEKQLLALQYLRYEHGLETAPTPSELLVLLKRRETPPAMPQRINEPEFSGEFAVTSPIVLDQCSRLGHLVNYPSRPYLVPDGDEFEVLMMPRLPYQIFATATQQDAPELAVYDAVKERYQSVPVKREKNDEWRFTCPEVCPGTVGYRIRIPKAAGFGTLRVVWSEALNWAQCFNRAFEFSAAVSNLQNQLEAERAEHAKQLNAINALANDIEARRASLESQLNQRSES
ncbi:MULTISPECIES: class I SAM-dependent methyltransferase [Achromobacter]|uniref:Class I SAM-dependent methyltransferase n=1 Tax=Achromobacter spanius TaxID=217203 RepID=A0ABY8GNP4_9BURK|nr:MULTISPECIES: class I SAM-dependent methyltransferase [Achromobacter]WAI84361.1 class I SAM-dependent methyltransferase [Achromobacter spanius]WEX94444.1 class I SAM-dependent methyltransferase [Achromobacter sp. SS2-2022]WFP06392.1 class I SAM-dependent methyltransferase [Achromobacter spanius]